MNERTEDGSQETEHLHQGALGKIVTRCEEVFFALILGALLLTGLLPLVCRFLELPGVNWSSSLSSQLVLWLALFGAGAATRDRKHISIDAVGHVLPQGGRLALRAATELLAGVVCGVLVPVAVSFVSLEAELTEGQNAFPGVPKGWLPAVIPVGLALLSLRLFLAAWVDVRASLGRGRERGHA